MRAAVARPGEPGSLRLADLPDPCVEAEDEVLVRGLAAGIDGTDHAVLEEGEAGDLPEGGDALVLAHEALGEVVETGPAVRSLAPGDRVTCLVRRPLRQATCSDCAAWRADMCPPGHYVEHGITGAHGFMAQRYVVPAGALVQVPHELGVHGVLVEPTSIAEKAIQTAWAFQRRFDWRPASALVLGAGSLGLLAAMALRCRRLEVHCVDLVGDDHPKARAARSLGARYHDGSGASIAEVCGDAGPFDLVLESTGHSPQIPEAVDALASAGVLLLLGVPADAFDSEVGLGELHERLVMGNRAVIGSVNSGREHFRAAARRLAFARREWPGALDAILNRVEPLERVEAAFERRDDDVKTAVRIVPEGEEL